MGLTSALAMSSRALEVYSTGIEVAGQNIANSSTLGYIREELILDPSDPYLKGALTFGSGVTVTGVKQSINTFLEVRIHTANTAAESASASNRIYQELESELRELGEGDLSTAVNDFLGSIDDVVGQPNSVPLRQIVIGEGERLASDIRDLRSRINKLRTSQTVKVESLVAEANRLIQEVTDLNPRISELEAGGLSGSDAGALRT